MATADVTRDMASGPIRWGLWLLAAGGILCTAIFTYWMTQGNLDPATDPQRYAADATSVGTLGSNVAYLVGLVLLLLGVIALYGLLAGGQHRSLALAGLVLNVASLSALLAGLGAGILGGAVVASLYQEGQTGVAPALVKLSGGTFGTPILIALGVAVALAILGAIATGLALWRDGTLPKWTAVVFGLGFVLFTTSFPGPTHLGGILLAIAGIGLVRSLERVAPAGAMEARPA